MGEISVEIRVKLDLLSLPNCFKQGPDILATLEALHSLFQNLDSLIYEAGTINFSSQL